MKHAKTITLASFIVFLGLLSTVHSQPIAPTQDVKSGVTDVTKSAGTAPLDLPYKPQDPVIDAQPQAEAIQQTENTVVSSDSETQNAGAPTEQTQSSVKYNFSNLPYLALKFPDYQPLVDPQ